MTFGSLLLLAVGLSMDAFAVSISQGARLKKINFKSALRSGLIFGIVEGLTPLAGWATGYVTHGLIMAWSHWLASILLMILGARMICAGWRNTLDQHCNDTAINQPSATVWMLILTAIATSIDALAIGIGLAFLQVNILQAALIIGCVSAIMSTLGIISGRFLGALLGRWAEIIGGLVLAGMAVQILISHFYP